MLGFRVISQELNMVMGPNSKEFFNLLEIVFMKEILMKVLVGFTNV